MDNICFFAYFPLLALVGKSCRSLTEWSTEMERDPRIVAFYKSRAWKKVSSEYRSKVANLCEKCFSEGKLVTGEIVHHKIHVTPETIDDPSITLNPDNLILVCRLCHAAEHPEMYGQNNRRYVVVGGKVKAFENYSST